MNDLRLVEIKEKVNNAIDSLVERDIFLLKNNVNERSISHRLAVYLEYQFEEWDVDCEYNRDHDRIKSVILHKIDSISSDIKPNDIYAKTVFPDIIIHKRNREENLLVIEMKKSTNTQSKDFDLEKLKAYRKDLGYTQTLFIKFYNNARKPEVSWDPDKSDIENKI